MLPDDTADDVAPMDVPEAPNAKAGATDAGPPKEKDGAEADAAVELDPAAPKENREVFGCSADLDESSVDIWPGVEDDGSGAATRLSSSSSSLLPEASRPTSTFLSGHWNLVGTPAFSASAFFCSSRSLAFRSSSAPRFLPTPDGAALVPLDSAAVELAPAAPETAPAPAKPNEGPAPEVNPKIEDLPPVSDTAGTEKERDDVAFDGAAPNLNPPALELIDSVPN
mmetsp:Transcript_34088/g.71562  ORF Transcript_34088/g.71562 Transcript_34088/m.71562 type:complete len:225 (-) Transcript_34088:804-1478(-)